MINSLWTVFNNHLLDLFAILLKQAVLSDNSNGLSLISLTVHILWKGILGSFQNEK